MISKQPNNSNSNPSPQLVTVCEYDTATDLRLLALEAGLSPSSCSQLDWQTWYNLHRHDNDETLFLTHDLRRLLALIDSKPHPNGLTMDEKNNMKDLASSVVDQLEGIKAQRKEVEMDKSKLIACMAHDLITPLTSIQLNLGLLTEDESLQQKLNKTQSEILRNTQVCVDIMSSICQYSIQSFRVKQEQQQEQIQRDTNTKNTAVSAEECCATSIQRGSHKSSNQGDDDETSSKHKVENSLNQVRQQDPPASSQSIKSNTTIEPITPTTPPTTASSSTSSSSTRIKRALIIEDSDTIRKVMHTALKRFGFHDVVEAENGLQGLEEMKREVFDIVLCDFLMPIMGGIDCVNQYRQWEKSHRIGFKQYIVGISAHADGDESTYSLSLGMDEFVKKPFPIQKLRELVERKNEIDTISQKIGCLAM